MQGIPRCCCSAWLALLPFVFVAANWTQFRGPGGSGASDATDLPTEWDASTGVLWKAELPGFGASSPIVVSDQVFLTYYNGYGLSEDDPGKDADLRQYLICFDLANGNTAWDLPYEPPGSVHAYQGFQALHGYASSTPASNGTRLFLFFESSGVGAVSLDGKKQWLQSVGTGTHNWGSGTSPVLYKNLVIVNASVESGALVALEQSDGQEVWRAEGMTKSWNTPVLVETSDRSTELVVNIKGQLLGFDPDNGEKLWWCDGFKDYVCPSAIAHEGVAFAIGARRSSAMAVTAGGRGDVTDTHLLWKITKGSNVSSPVYHEGYLYWVHQDRGTAYCVDGKSGEVIYEERLSPRPGKIYASPVVADGKIYIVTRSKGVFVLAAKPEFELLAHNQPLDESIFNGSPAIVDGKLLIRSDGYLYCIGNEN